MGGNTTRPWTTPIFGEESLSDQNQHQGNEDKEKKVHACLLISILSCMECEKGEDNCKEKKGKEQRLGKISAWYIFVCMWRRKSNTIRSDWLIEEMSSETPNQPDFHVTVALEQGMRLVFSFPRISCRPDGIMYWVGDMPWNCTMWWLRGVLIQIKERN